MKNFKYLNILLASTLLIIFLFCTSLADAQNGRRITGQIVTKSGKVMPGVTIAIKGETGVLVSDSKGDFSIAAPAGATLIFSHVGYGVQEVVVRNQETINITLAEEKNELSQVV